MAKRFTVPDGWAARGFAFEVEWPDDPGPVWSHFGARRKAFNWALTQVKIGHRHAAPGMFSRVAGSGRAFPLPAV